MNYRMYMVCINKSEYNSNYTIESNLCDTMDEALLYAKNIIKDECYNSNIFDDMFAGKKYSKISDDELKLIINKLKNMEIEYNISISIVSTNRKKI